jgi:alpha-methylacyl-CoA racemase
MNSTTPIASKGPLDGFRIIEMAGLGPGPFCAMLLADMGAEVIRIQGKGKPQGLLLNTPFDVLARGRRSLAIDLKTPGAKDVVLDLVARADALIEGFRPGVMERLGLGPEACFARNRRLVYGRMTGWGQTGPLAPSAGHDINYLALTGVLHAIGPRHDVPSVPLNVAADMGGGGLLLAFGIVCALLEARRSGQGQTVDAAMIEGASLLAAMVHGFKAGGVMNSQRCDNVLDGGAYYYAVYECADGRYIAVGAIEPQFHARLLETLGLDPSTFGPQADRSRWQEGKTRLAEVFKTATRDEWVRRFEGVDACVSPVLDWDEAITHPHNQARKSFVEIAGVPQPAPAPRFSRTPAAVPRPPAEAGQDTAAVLADWGVGAAVVSGLSRCGAI